MVPRSGRGVGRYLLAGLVAVLAVLGAATVGQAAKRAPKSVNGVVVHRDSKAGSFIVATSKGALVAVHSASQGPAPGTKVSVTIKRLKDGTYAATGSPKVGRHGKHALRVHAKGVVSHVNAAGHTFTLSSTGVSMIVHQRSTAPPPAVGHKLDVTGTVDGEDEGEIEEEDQKEEGENSGAFHIEGVISAINELERTLTISSEDNNEQDDQEETEKKLTVHVPEGPPSNFVMSMFHLEEEVELNVTPIEGKPNEFTLVGSSDDEGEQNANDNEDEQGEQEDEGEGTEKGHEGTEKDD